MAIIALLVGSILYFRQMGLKNVGVYWGVTFGVLALSPLITAYGSFAIQALIVAIYFAHAKSKQING